MVRGMVSIAHNDGPTEGERKICPEKGPKYLSLKPNQSYLLGKTNHRNVKENNYSLCEKGAECGEGLETPQKQLTNERTNERVKVIEQTLTASISSRVTLSLDLIASEAGSDVTEASVSDCLSVEEKKINVNVE